MSMEMLMDVFADGLLDSLKLIPFLFVTYLLMEYLEHKTNTRTRAVIRKAGRLGPLAGSIVGVFPQCGFSAAASNLYAGGVITTGTLLAVFLSTSDEMLPIFVSEAVDLRIILMILGLKVIIGVITGFLVDFIFRFRPSTIRYKEIHSMCESEHCGCEEGVFRSALKHTLKIFGFIFIFSVVLGLLVTLGGEDRIASLLAGYPLAGPLVAGIVGLIPNCASSVVITDEVLTTVFEKSDQFRNDDVRTSCGSRRGASRIIPRQ